MAICIVMHKLNENKETVSYKFETSIADGYYLSKSRNLRRTIKYVYGYCEFNKTTEQFVVDKDKTDPHFFENPYYEGLNYEAFKVWMKLVNQKRDNAGFPDLLSVCS